MKNHDYKIEIKRNSDDKICNIFQSSDTSLIYFWADGSFSCDCNRHIKFQRALGEIVDSDISCGDGKYSIRITDLSNNEIVYDEIKTL